MSTIDTGNNQEDLTKKRPNSVAEENAQRREAAKGNLKSTLNAEQIAKGFVISDQDWIEADKKSPAFYLFQKMYPNVDSIRQYGQQAEADGVDKGVLNRLLQQHIQREERSIERRTQQLSTGEIGGGSRFMHGASATTSYIKAQLENDSKRLVELRALARERNLALN